MTSRAALVATAESTYLTFLAAAILSKADTTDGGALSQDEALKYELWRTAEEALAAANT